MNTKPFPEDSPAAWERARGPFTRADGRVVIGRVGAPPNQEATSAQFCFWVPEDALVEATQIVTAKSRIGGRDLTFYALVDEVHRCSRKRGMGHEVDDYDGDLAEEPPYASEGITYASASILRTEPPYLTPPRERSDVLVASDDEARIAYSADRMDDPLAIGLIKNGGDATAGPGFIDLAYLLGANGGHLNVNGAAGRGTKSSFLLTVLYFLLAHAREQARTAPSDPDRLRVVPIIFNVKNFDLFFIDRPSTRYDSAKHASDWATLGFDDPRPFENVAYFAPQQPGSSALAVPTGRTRGDVQPYSWSLGDVIERGLLPFLFSDEDAANDNFAALVLDLENWLTDEDVLGDGTVRRRLRANWDNVPGGPINTFGRLLAWLRTDGAQALGADHHQATRKKLSRRLLKLLYESRGVLRRDDLNGHPLNVVRADTSDPIVIDLNALAGEASLQRFVVATVLRQLIEARTGASAIRGLKYLVMLDELNRFAPKGSRDPITRLIETVASEMRSQGVLLFGAQQQASLVSTKVIENAGIRAIGQTGTLELSNTVWKGLSPAAKRKADALPTSEKLILQSGFREPMHLRVPFPAWAMNPGEEVRNAPAPGDQKDDLSDLGDL